MTSSDHSPVTLRPALRADAPSLGRLGALLVQVHHDFDEARFIEPTSETAREYGGYVSGQIGRKNAVVLVAERKGEIVGYTWGSVEGYDYMSLRGPAGLINDIIVDPAHRGHGIGGMLLTAALAELRDRGAPRVVLSTAEKNESAQRLFERAGFRRTMVEMTRESDAQV